MKFMIAGLGSIGRRHLRNLQAVGEKDFLLLRTHRASLPDDELAGIPVETDLGAALAHKPDAVIVSNPTALHLDVAIPAARAGCHILLEKPVSHNMERIAELRAVAAQSGSRILVGFQFRYHPGLREIVDQLQAKAIGDPVSARAHWGEYLPGWHPWEDYRKGYSARADLGGGVVLTLTHPLDYLRMLLGEVSALWAFAGKLSNLELDVEDTAEIGLQFASGVIGSVHLDYVQRPPRHQLEIVGTLGTIRWDFASGDVNVYHPEEESWRNYPAPYNFERNDMFLTQVQHFREVVKGTVAPACTLEDGVRAQELARASLESAKSGQIVRL
jgi:predicted dehydrogenase